MSPCDPRRKLPNEVLHQIFRELSVKDWFNCLEVCKSWHGFITSDSALWRSSINDPENGRLLSDSNTFLRYAAYDYALGTAGEDRLLCNSIAFRKCVDYAVGTAGEDVVIRNVEIEVSQGDSARIFAMLSKCLLNQPVKRINEFSLLIAFKDDYVQQEISGFVYNQVPISNFAIYSYGKGAIRLDTLLKSQANSLEELELGLNVITSNTVVFCPLLKTLSLSSEGFSQGVIESISGCANLKYLNLNGKSGNDLTFINHLLNRVPNSVESLLLTGFMFGIDPQYGDCSWPGSLTSLVLHTDIDSYDSISGSLEGLRELEIDGDGIKVVQFFNKYKCGPNLEKLSLRSLREIPDPDLYRNVRDLDLRGSALGSRFTSNCSKLKNLNEINLSYVNLRGDELLECMLELAKNNTKNIHIQEHGLDDSHIKKITGLGVSVVNEDADGLVALY